MQLIEDRTVYTSKTCISIFFLLFAVVNETKPPGVSIHRTIVSTSATRDHCYKLFDFIRVSPHFNVRFTPSAAFLTFSFLIVSLNVQPLMFFSDSSLFYLLLFCGNVEFLACQYVTGVCLNARFLCVSTRCAAGFTDGS